MTGNETNIAISRVREAIENLTMVEAVGPNDVADGFEMMDRLTVIVLRWNETLAGEREYLREDCPHEPELNPLSLAAQAEAEYRPEQYHETTRW